MSTRSVAGAVLVIFVSGASLVGQPGAAPPEFEVASVKPAKADFFDVNTHLPSLNIEPGRTLNFANITLKDLIMLAYGAGAAQVSGPDWLVNRFDIVAKIPSDAAKERIPMMMQTLLARRFKLALHREQKNISVYALEISSGGAKLQESVVGASVEPGCTRSYAQSPGAAFAAVCYRMTSASLAQAVQTMAPNYFDRPMVDMTGLKGVYDLTLEWNSFSESTNGDTGPTIFDATTTRAKTGGATASNGHLCHRSLRKRADGKLSLFTSSAAVARNRILASATHQWRQRPRKSEKIFDSRLCTSGQSRIIWNGCK